MSSGGLVHSPNAEQKQYFQQRTKKNDKIYNDIDEKTNRSEHIVFCIQAYEFVDEKNEMELQPKQQKRHSITSQIENISFVNTNFDASLFLYFSVLLALIHGVCVYKKNPFLLCMNEGRMRRGFSN